MPEKERARAKKIRKDPLSLPYELVLEILSYLTLREKIRCRRVSRRWNALIDRPSTYKILDFSTTKISKRTLLLYISKAKGVLDLRTTHTLYVDLPKVQILSMPVVTKTYKTLRHLSVNTMDMDRMWTVTTSCPLISLKTALTGVGRQHSKKPPLRVLHTGRLTEAQLTCITHNYALTEMALLYIGTAKWPPLTKLIVEGEVNLPSSLVELHIRGRHVNLEGLSLKRLRLSEFLSIPPLNGLLELALAPRYEAVDDDELALIGQGNPDLVHAEFTHCLFSSTALAKFVTATKLRSLRILYCGQVTSDVISWIKGRNINVFYRV